MANFYLVGGAVRDMLLGLPVKDYDYAVECESFDAMRDAIIERGGKIFVEIPEYLIIRAIDVSGDITGLPKMATDFVMCRKDGEYVDGRRPEDVTPGTLLDDLARRDFTVNAMAIPAGGSIDEVIDLFGGRDDLARNILRTVGNAEDRFNEDTLRILRAIRFSITKGFFIDPEIIATMTDDHFVEKMGELSVDRRRVEMEKCFASDTAYTLWYLNHYCSPKMVVAIFRNMWLKPTTEGVKDDH
jgi:tRNA nucleotidyltransferase (CCA-adding enzyme)